MKTIFKTMSSTLSAGLCLAFLVSKPTAGCGDVSSLSAPWTFAPPAALARVGSQTTRDTETASARGAASASIVGLWKVQLISLGNVSHSPSIPDGAIIDFGYAQWHSDGTEILNSGGHAPATGNFCLGVWGTAGFQTFELNHFHVWSVLLSRHRHPSDITTQGQPVFDASTATFGNRRSHRVSPYPAAPR
jgi:hypothetical protein